ncbi:Pilus assembly protein [Paramixta manurensis]|uniref:Pilus assembly protein n=1 Tax=Paramixta manurensis TaxID=2740817 RepID=A0A6M8UF88_9GAMM|nr:Pilus assembly protein [Erwiniaceae bacterium PD-1]
MRNIKLVILGLLVCSFSAVSGVVINKTRVIYPEGKKEVTVRLENRNSYPSLVQSWIDEGKKDKEIKKIDVPFVLLPPISRIEPNQGQTLRVNYVGSDGTDLPVDRESIFWLNVMDIPPQAENVDGNALQMAIRTRIKLFFRPESLKNLSPTDAAEKLLWKVVSSEKGRFVLEANNNSAFHVSLSSINIVKNEKEISHLSGEMVSPFSHKTFTFSTRSAEKADHVVYQYINDYGATVKVEKEI